MVGLRWMSDRGSRAVRSSSYGGAVIPATGGITASHNHTTAFRRRGDGTTTRHALVIGGTGMLSACTSALVAEGWHVVLPSRRYAPLLAPGAPIVEVHGSAAAVLLDGYPEPVLPDHPTQQVVLGFVPVGRTSRRLSHEEISAGVMAAVERALAGKPPAVHQVGEPRPWSTSGRS